MLREAGVTDDQIDPMSIDNPRRFFAGRQGDRRADRSLSGPITRVLESQCSTLPIRELLPVREGYWPRRFSNQWCA